MVEYLKNMVILTQTIVYNMFAYELYPTLLQRTVTRLTELPTHL